MAQVGEQAVRPYNAYPLIFLIRVRRCGEIFCMWAAGGYTAQAG